MNNAFSASGVITEVLSRTQTGWSTLIKGTVYRNEPVILFLHLNGIFFRSIKVNEFVLNSLSPCMNFQFLVGDLTLPLLPPNTKIEIYLEDEKLPISFADGVTAVISGQASDGGVEFVKRLKSTSAIDHWGNIQRTFGKNPELKRDYLEFYVFWKEYLKNILNYDLYIVGGALLGIVREGDFLGHDDDIDAAILIKSNDYKEVNAIFFGFYDDLISISASLNVKLTLCGPGHLQIFDLKRSLVLDIFASWIDDAGNFGRVIGTFGRLPTSEFKFSSINFDGYKLSIPFDSEQDLALTYGPNWKTPDPHFVWKLDEACKAKMQLFREKGWADFRKRSPA